MSPSSNSMSKHGANSAARRNWRLFPARPISLKNQERSNKSRAWRAAGLKPICNRISSEECDMSATGLEVFDTTLQKTNEWLQEMMQEFGTESRQQVYLILRATLHALRERLPLEPMAHLGAQLPMLIRGFYYEGWSP